jgi:DNA-binding transcriptional MerR regulator
MERYTTKDIADMLNVEAVTIRKYALALEKAGYIIERSDGKNRTYNDKDAMAFKYLQSIRSRTSITVEEAASLIVQRNNTDTDQVVNIGRSDSSALPTQYDERYDALASQVRQLVTLLTEQQQLAAALPSETEQRSQRIDERLTERRIERQLEREALDRWKVLPETQRTKKVGLFRREEDTSARELFVRDYIDEHFEQRIREAYQM